MIAKGKVITHGGNAIRYSTDKDKAEIVKVNLLPEFISSSAIWDRMIALQQQFKEKLNRHRPLKNTSIRIELSPAREETQGWTMDDWVKLADEFIREFDAIDLSEKVKRDSASHTNLQNSQYVVSLHHDSKGQILHLHINANRIDMDGNVNDAHYINERAMMAANKITEKRGWIQAEAKRHQNIEQITADCISILRSMDSFDWNDYHAKLAARGYGVMLKRDSKGTVVGYTIKKGNSSYKSSVIGHSRNLTPSRIEKTWLKLHPEKSQTIQSISSDGSRIATPIGIGSTQLDHHTPTSRPIPQESVKSDPIMYHHDFEANGEKFSFDIPEEIDNILMNETTLPDDVLWSTLESVQHTAILLLFGYINAAAQYSESCGGGGGTSSDLPWGRDHDEDDREWARRCAKMAHIMHKRPSRGYHR